jgi:hypothetical protein
MSTKRPNKFRRTIFPSKSWRDQKWAKDVCFEHGVNLDNIEAEGEVVDLALAVSEAKYVLSCYFESGHSAADELQSPDPDVRSFARSEVRDLKKFIRKYESKVQQ